MAAISGHRAGLPVREPRRGNRRHPVPETPETETSTHDFWPVARDFALDDEWVTDYLRENNREVVMQDVVALSLLEELIAADGNAYQELSISIDAGGLAARRLIKRLLEAQCPGRRADQARRRRRGSLPCPERSRSTSALDSRLAHRCPPASRTGPADSLCGDPRPCAAARRRGEALRRPRPASGHAARRAVRYAGRRERQRRGRV